MGIKRVGIKPLIRSYENRKELDGKSFREEVKRKDTYTGYHGKKACAKKMESLLSKWWWHFKTESQWISIMVINNHHLPVIWFISSQQKMDDNQGTCTVKSFRLLLANSQSYLYIGFHLPMIQNCLSKGFFNLSLNIKSTTEQSHLPVHSFIWPVFIVTDSTHSNFNPFFLSLFNLSHPTFNLSA
ncbi:hypothetical protein QVD17_04441 [Tagetes erecta]|uniref:Uncharacterized protein n=1 Tax=Tagetes erecta TaxID=13708 RepID=A0AAD8PAQ8_TARER|nr:hypothetical protein QVD17_04441 [Tagetes erecta]